MDNKKMQTVDPYEMEYDATNERQQALKAAFDACDAIWRRWGNVSSRMHKLRREDTPYDGLKYHVNGYTIRRLPKGRYVASYGAGLDGASTEAVFTWIPTTIAAVAQHLAAEDFRQKAAGSIRRLKNITAAISDE